MTELARGGAARRPLLIHRVIARLNVGGPAMHVVNLARTMNDGPWRTRLVAGSLSPDEGDMGYYAAERGVTVTHLESLTREIRAADDLRALTALYRLFRRERPDVVHTHTAKAGTLGRLAAVLAGVPVRVHTYHGHVLGGGYFSARRTRLFLEVERQLARVTERLVVLTRRQAREMSEVLRVAEHDRFSVVPLGLELDRFAEMERCALRAHLRHQLGLVEGTPAVGIVGRLVPIKNHDLFLEAVAALRGIRTDATAVVIGSGDQEARLKALAGSLGLADRVRWLGWRRDLPALYSALDVVALTSHDEGTPVALLEALAAGTPVVARDVGGVAEVLGAAGAGVVVPARAGARVWAAALDRELDVTEVPAHVRRAVAERYSVARLAVELDALYRRALALRGRTPA